MEYFKTKYLAHRIPWEYVLRYEDVLDYKVPYFHDSSLAFEKACLGADEMNPFNYEKEKNITLTIDTYYNKELRLKYPNIERMEDILSEQRRNISDIYVPSTVCPVIVIGTKANDSINSMFETFGSLNDIAAIPDLDYEMWYFYKHS